MWVMATRSLLIYRKWGRVRYGFILKASCSHAETPPLWGMRSGGLRLARGPAQREQCSGGDWQDSSFPLIVCC